MGSNKIIRQASLKRETKETQIYVDLKLDGSGKSDIDTGIGFLDHMLILFSKHGMFDLSIKADGDLNVDSHHTIEDLGIVLGQCFYEAIGDKMGIARYGTAYVPMDEALAMVAVDVSNRSYLVFNCEFTSEMLGSMQTEMFEEFLRAFSDNARVTLHANLLYGKNNHHKAEAIFKALGRALKEAVRIDESIVGVMSTKGTL